MKCVFNQIIYLICDDAVREFTNTSNLITPRNSPAQAFLWKLEENKTALRLS